MIRKKRNRVPVMPISMLDLFAMTLLVVLANQPKFHADLHVENLPSVSYTHLTLPTTPYV